MPVAMGITIKWQNMLMPLMIFFSISLLISAMFILPVTNNVIKYSQESPGTINNQSSNPKYDEYHYEKIKVELNLHSREELPNWPMFGKDSAHTHKAIYVSKGVYQPSLKWDKWSQLSGNGIDSRATTIGNFSNNINWLLSSSRNVKHVVYADNGLINILDGGSGEPVWQLDVDLIDGTLDNDLILTTPTLGYFNDNTKLDVLFGTTDGDLCLYEPSMNYDETNGYSWSSDNVNQDKVWILETGGNFTRASSVLGKLDGDIYPDTVLGSSNHLFAVSGLQGKELWSQNLPGDIVSTPVLYKDGSDLNTLVLVLNQTATLLNYSASFFDAKSSTGNRLDVKYYDISTLPIPNQIPSPTVGELDGNTNNDKEIIITTPFEGIAGNGRVYVYYTNRTLFWSTPANAITGQIEATPAIADLDGDGMNEIIIISWRIGTLGPVTHVYAFHGNNGTQLWHVVKDTVGLPPIYTNEQAVASPIISDVNTDGTLDVVFTTSPNIYSIDGKNGTDLWSISLLGTGRELWSTPAAADIDNDGFLDIIADGAAISHVIVDLTLKQDDLSISNENITENTPVTIKAVIHNIGTAVANNVKVSMFENDILIGNDTIGSIPGEDSRETRIDWTPSQDGNRLLKVIIDPLNSIEEINEKNNEISREVYVIPTYPDFLIESIEYYRGDGKRVDNENNHLVESENSTLRINVKNIGGDSAKDIQIRLLDSGDQVGNIKVLDNLDINELKNVTYSWSATKGNHDLTIQVDPGNNIYELNESNNQQKEKVFIKSKIPSDPEFICSGIIYNADTVTPVPGIEVSFKNNRTGSKKATKTNSSGYYKTDLQTLPGKYYEGDEIVIYATDGENQSSFSFFIYSEDKSRFDNITLIKMPTYAVTISVDSGEKIIYPNQNVKYNVTIINLGNEYNTVNLSLSDVIDVKTNSVATNWNSYLNEYMVEDIPPKKSLSGIVLTVKAPSKNEDAVALDQVLVAITAKSVYDTTQSDIIGVTTTVGRLYNFEITTKDSIEEMDPLNIDSVEFSAKIKNSGNDDDSILLSIDEISGWEIDIENELDLKMGEEKEVNFILQTDDSIEAGEYIFTLSVTSIDGKGKSTLDFVVRVIRPDLKFYTNITTTPVHPKLGENINFKALIFNNGTSTVSNFFIEFKVKSVVVNIETISNLSASTYQSVEFNWSADDPGNYLVEFIIDPYNDILENNKENNKISFTISFIQDLAVLKLPEFSNSNPKQGENVDITVTVENIGNVDITDRIIVEIYDGDPDIDGSLISNEVIEDGLEVNMKETLSIEWKATNGGNDHEIFVIVNPDRSISEIDYENNIISKTILVLKGTSTSDVDDNFAWIILIIIGIAILIIIFMIAIPPKQPAYRSGRSRTSQKKRAGREKGKARGSRSTGRRDKDTGDIIKSGRTKIKDKVKDNDLKFIVLDEVDVLDEDYDDEDISKYGDEFDDEYDSEYSEDSRKRRARGGARSRMSKKSVSGLLGGLFSSLGRNQSRRKRELEKKSRRKSVRVRTEDDSDSDFEGTNKDENGTRSKRRSQRYRSKDRKGDKDPDAGAVEVTGIGDNEIGDFDTDEDDYSDDEISEMDEYKSRRKQKPKDKPRKKEKEKDNEKEKDLSWEYSQLIGIR